MQKIVKKVITLVLICVMAVSMPISVSAKEECPHGVYTDSATYGKSFLMEHMNGTCSIYTLYRKVELKCVYCGYTAETHVTTIGEEHSMSHP